MDRKERGSLYLEALTAFAAVSVLVLILLPAGLENTLNRKAILMELEAEALLSHTVIKSLFGEDPDGKKIGKWGEYHFSVTGREEDQRKTICLEYQDPREKEKRLCRTVRK